MAKVGTVPAGRRRRKKFLKRAKGFVGGRRKLYRSARETVQRAMMFATRDRRDTKSVMRKLWITRISAALGESGLNYSRFIAGLKKANVELDRKIMSELAIHDPKAFVELVRIAKG